VNADPSVSARRSASPSAAEWVGARGARLNGPARITGVDLARGLAVIGMLAAHLITMDPLVWTDSATWPAIVQGRSSILFATLAGVSIGIVTGGRTPWVGERMSTARLRLVARASFLWVLGVLLITTGVPILVILPAYAILFLLAIPFTGFRAGTLFVVAGGIALVAPLLVAFIDTLGLWDGDSGRFLELLIGWHYPFVSWIAFVVAGLAATRAGLGRTVVQVGLIAGGAALTIAAGVLEGLTGFPVDAEPTNVWEAVWTAEAHSGGILEVVGSGGFALAVLGACLLLCRTFAVWIVLPLRAVGSMPLSAYAGQILVWAAVALAVLGETNRLFAFRELEPFPAFAVGTIGACTLWALALGRGPLEWVSDALTRFMVPGGPSEQDIAADRLER
jgi:hypothetical protein